LSRRFIIRRRRLLSEGSALAGALLLSASTAGSAMIDVFKKHVEAELAGDLDTTMATMIGGVPYGNTNGP
jgi:hypothetical protein